MRNLLHDEKDSLEDVQERWRGEMEKIRSAILDVASEAQDFREVFTAVNVLAAEALADLTTEAAQVGISFGQRKAKTRD